jgi:hypothetical protein
MSQVVASSLSSLAAVVVLWLASIDERVDRTEDHCVAFLSFDLGAESDADDTGDEELTSRPGMIPVDPTPFTLLPDPLASECGEHQPIRIYLRGPPPG